jgi:hypothetical protein
MRKMTVPLAVAAATAVVTAVVMSLVSGPVSTHAQARPVSSYGEDRAAIEDLQALPGILKACGSSEDRHGMTEREQRLFRVCSCFGLS